MRAVAIREYGGRDRLELLDLPKPVPQPGEALIRVRAAGVNPVDIKIREGLLKNRLPNQFPIILGWDAAGVIEDTGEEVFAYCRKPVIQHGTYAEYVAAPKENIAPKPASVDMATAAGIPLSGLTAYQSLFDAAGLQSGQRVLIHAGAGGVGGFGVQLARNVGAEVWCTCSARNTDYVVGLGAHHVVDYTAGDFRDVVRDMDVVFDTVGGDVQTRSADVLKRGGTLVSILAYADEAGLKAKGIETKYVFVAPNGRQLRHLQEMVDDGQLVCHISASFPLEQAARAHELIETRHTRGKIILTVK